MKKDQEKECATKFAKKSAREIKISHAEEVSQSYIRSKINK
jgi:hypothetical protein